MKISPEFIQGLAEAGEIPLPGAGRVRLLQQGQCLPGATGSTPVNVSPDGGGLPSPRRFLPLCQQGNGLRQGGGS